MSHSSNLFAPPPRILGYRSLIKPFIMGCALLLIFSSCEQDDAKTPIADPASEYAMYYKILTFLEQKEGKPITQPVLTPRTTYSPLDILDYVEGGMNLQYTDSRLSWASYDVRTDTFTVALSSGYASQQAMEDLFDEIEDTASVHFYGISEPDKFPFLYDATNISNSLTLMTLSVTSRVGKVHRDPTPFGSTDYWDVEGGKCGPYSGGTLEASEVIANALNDYYDPYGCTFYTNVETAYYSDLYSYGWGQANSSDPTPGDFIVDFRTYLFYCWDYHTWGDPETWGCEEAIGFPDCEDFDVADIRCLEPWEMNYYFESIRSIYADYRNAQPNPYLTHIYSEIHLGSDLCLAVQEGWDPEVSFGQPNSCDSSNYPTYLPPCCN